MFRKLITILLVAVMVILQPLSAFAQIPAEEMGNAAQPEENTHQYDPEAEDNNQASIPGGQFIPGGPSPTHTIYLKSRQFEPTAIDSTALSNLAGSGKQRAHILVQLDFIPRDLAKAELEAQGLKLMAYVPDYAWIASVSTSDAATVLQLPGVAWAGALRVEDKLAPAIKSDTWGPHNLTPDGSTAAVYVVMHKDESLENGRLLAEALGGQVTSEVIGINMLVVEIPRDNILVLAAEDAVQWIEPAGIPLGEANDGSRAQIGVNTVNGAPYNLDGTGIDVLVYDSGQAGDHVDFGTRLTHGDADSVSYHSTHVAGTVGGDGANSASEGGTALQWRGMAPAVDLISYGTGYPGTGVIFYENVPDIEADWAAAQNTYGADLGTASLGSNIYDNYPSRCDLMGLYGGSSVLIDQIVRGGNSVVGIGDKYIATWAAGNERNSAGSCSDTYNSIAPPAAAKNPIHVGASNTNNNTMTTFSSWGPTEDGRIKPIVVAGGCQSNGDFGITSTDNNPVDDYFSICGTSMATPAVAGGIALMLEHYRDEYSTSGEFWPSTAKAILMHTADDFGHPGPDFQWGYGQVDIQAAVDLITARAFHQGNVSDGDVDVYYLAVTNSVNPLLFSLAWDDFEATLNANPTLINNLDLELVSPSGTISRPWILDPDNPANNATTGIDNRNNQEQVRVLNPEVGTWMIRVRGTTVPQGPQDYSLVCEGCQALDLGVCQSLISGATSAAAAQFEASQTGTTSSEDQTPEGVTLQPELTEGEYWQRTLEAEGTPAEAGAQPALAAALAARNSDPEVGVALLENLDGLTLDLAVDENQADQTQIMEPGPTDENDAGDAAAINRVGINGASCAYTTIQNAVIAASNGDVLQVSAGVYFENIVINNKSLTIAGDYYSNCTSTGGGETRIEGSLGTGSTLDISNGTVELRDLVVAWGINLAGGGINAQGANITLDNVEVAKNYALVAGGIYINPTSAVTLTNDSNINQNAVAGGGGGIGVEGQLYGSSSNIVNNCAPDGGGIYSYGGYVQLETVGLVVNQAAGEGGKGGGIWANDGSAVHSSATTLIGGNTATNGGGLYLEAGSSLNATETFIGFPLLFLWSNLADIGAGIYADTSTVDFSGTIDLNIADNSGAGVYATNSTINLTDATVGGNTESWQGNQLGSNGHAGVGLYLTGGTQAVLDNTIVVSNTFQTAGYTYGGGIYITSASSLALTNNSSVEDHLAPSVPDGRGAGIYINASMVTLDNSQIISNTAGTVGGAIRMFGSSTLNVQNGATISNNRSRNGEGGAIAAAGTPDINITGGTFQHNRAGTDGGAIYLDAGTLDLNGWYDFRWNLAEGNGGAVAVLGTGDADFYTTSGISYLGVNFAVGNGGALYVANTDIVRLHATSGYQLRMNTNNANGDGGAAYADDGAFFDVYGDLQATSNNASGDGGVFYLQGVSSLWLRDHTNGYPSLWVNEADNGGAIYAQDSPRVECDGAEFGGSRNGNQATAGDGGAVFLIASSFNADNCVFQNNQATDNGGAIAAYKSSDLTIDTDYPVQRAIDLEEGGTNDALAPGAPTALACDPSVKECSSFRYNTADSNSRLSGSGGAIYLSDSSLQVDYTYLHHNIAHLGGAIYQEGTSSDGLVRNSLIHHNVVSGKSGAGIYPYRGSFSLSHVTLADNIGAAGYSGDPATTNKVVNSIAWGNSGGGFVGPFTSSTCNIDQSGNVGSNTDPLFANPGAENYHLQTFSPAIDACGRGSSPDLDNLLRPFGKGYDMGAYEYYLYSVYLPLILR